MGTHNAWVLAQPASAESRIPLRFSSKSVARAAALLVFLVAWTGRAGAHEAPLECNVPVLDTFASSVESHFFSFDASDERVTVTVVREPSLPSGPVFTPEWRLLDGTGMPATSSGCGSFSVALRQDCVLSAVDSPYRVQVRERFQDEVGSFWVHLQRTSAEAACDITLLTCGGETFVTALEPVVDNDLFGFCVAEGGIVSVSVVGGSSSVPPFTPEWRLLDGTGMPATSSGCGSFSTSPQDCGVLSETGNPYRLQVQERFHNDTGIYGVFVAPLFAGACIDCPCPLLDLNTQTVSSTEEFINCSISAGDGFEIISPGDVTFQVGKEIILRSGFSVGSGAKFTAINGFP
jgi:hypothetical protein